jgi:hypothetical protein
LAQEFLVKLLAHPALQQVTIEIWSKHFNIHATVAERTERDRIFAEVTRQAPDFAKDQKEISRIMPIVLLERVNGRD